MRTLVTAVALVVALTAVGCAAKASREDCAKACENVSKLYLGAVERESGSDEVLKAMGEAGSKMAREMASLQIDFLRQECEQECNERATRNLTDCLINARTSEDLERCN